MTNPIFVKSKLKPYVGATCHFCGDALTEDYYFNINKQAKKKYSCPDCNDSRLEKIAASVQMWRERQKMREGDPVGHIRDIMREDR